MYTFQDLLTIDPTDEPGRMEFVRAAINMHKTTDLYENAVIADDYMSGKNTTITEFQKLIYSLDGTAYQDTLGADYKLSSGFLKRFVVQENQTLLSNGVKWKSAQSVKKLGDDFDSKLQKAGIAALAGGVSFGFYNLDHVDVFKVTEFVPLWDEENGSLSAGIRFWQIDPSKPLRATLFEKDGLTEYVWNKRREGESAANGVGEILQEKRAYKLLTRKSEADGLTIYDMENYPGFPIVPLWGNPEHQSVLVGLREQIDAYDLIKSGFCNTVDESSIVYWLIQGAGGMDDFDLQNFVDRVRRNHAAAPQDGQSVETRSIEPHTQSRVALLEMLSRDLYRDAMALDTESIAGGAATATQIRAAYEPLNNKIDQYEYCVLDFLQGIMDLAGIVDEPSFTRSILVNAQETTQIVLQSAEYLSKDYVTKKILSLLGDGDQLDEVLKEMDAENMERMQMAMAMSGVGAPGSDGDQGGVASVAQSGTNGQSDGQSDGDGGVDGDGNT